MGIAVDKDVDVQRTTLTCVLKKRSTGSVGELRMFCPSKINILGLKLLSESSKWYLRVTV